MSEKCGVENCIYKLRNPNSKQKEEKMTVIIMIIILKIPIWLVLFARQHTYGRESHTQATRGGHVSASILPCESLKQR